MFRADLNRVVAVALLVVVPVSYAGKSKKRSDLNHAPTTSASTQPLTQPTTQPSSTPTALVGKWMYGSVSPTTYWDSDTGVFKGNARGSAGIYEFDDNGRYKEYIYLELRTAGLTSKAWTVHEGTVTFAGDHFTLHVERGHYQFWTNDKLTTDRDMKPDEAEKLSKAYKWTMNKSNDGDAGFVVPFDDGSKMEYRRQAK